MKKYLAAVSGGSDSMTMLDMYVRQISVVCHVNYQKRLSAKRDAEIAEQYCKSHKIIFKRLLVTKSIYDEYHKISHNFQNIARLIRYDFFTKIAHKYSLDTVLIAHNKDDFLETAIMQVQRNTAAPFIGIQTKSQYKDLNIYRPLLNVWKKTILNYCDHNKIKYGLDETNELNIYERNRIRNSISKWSLKDKNMIYNEFQKFNKKHKKLFFIINKYYEQWKKSKFNINLYRKMEDGLQIQIIYKYLREYDVSRLSFNKMKLVQQFLMGDNNKTKLRIGTNSYLAKIKDKLVIVK